jgi:hypothetical protein
MLVGLKKRRFGCRELPKLVSYNVVEIGKAVLQKKFDQKKVFEPSPVFRMSSVNFTELNAPYIFNSVL